MAYIAVLGVLPLAALGVGFLRVGLSHTNEHRLRVDNERARLLAEAAFEEAVFALRHGEPASFGSEDAPALFGHGLVWVDSTDLGDGRHRVRAMGATAGGRAALDTVVRVAIDDDAIGPIFSGSDLKLSTLFCTDGFDSTEGSWLQQALRLRRLWVAKTAQVASNGDIDLHNYAFVLGDAHPGPGKRVRSSRNSILSGSTVPLPKTVELETIAVPSIESSGSMRVDSRGGVTIPPGDYNYERIQLMRGQLTFQGPANVVVDDFDMIRTSALCIDSRGGPVKMYVKGRWGQGPFTCTLTTGHDARDFELNFVGGPSQNSTIRSLSSFYGVVRSPEGKVHLGGLTRICGTVRARRLQTGVASIIHYDVDLMRSRSSSVTVQVESLGTAAFPSVEMRAKRIDPLRILDVDASELPSLADLRELSLTDSDS